MESSRQSSAGGARYNESVFRAEQPSAASYRGEQRPRRNRNHFIPEETWSEGSAGLCSRGVRQHRNRGIHRSAADLHRIRQQHVCRCGLEYDDPPSAETRNRPGAEDYAQSGAGHTGILLKDGKSRQNKSILKDKNINDRK